MRKNAIFDRISFSQISSITGYSIPRSLELITQYSSASFIPL